MRMMMMMKMKTMKTKTITAKTMFRNLNHLQGNLVLAMVGTDTYGARTMAGG